MAITTTKVPLGGTVGKSNYLDKVVDDLLSLDATLNQPWLSYTPVWSSSGTQPVRGNGTVVGGYRQIGKTVTARGSVNPGSTTTFGTGSYRVSVPVAATAGSQNQSVGVLWMFNSGVAAFVGSCVWVNATTLWLVATNGTDVSPTSPHTWKANDMLRWSITYEAA